MEFLIVLFGLLIIIGIPAFFFFIFVVCTPAVKRDAKKLIDIGYKGIRVPLYKYNDIITALDICGEEGKLLQDELRKVRDGKIAPQHQLEHELQGLKNNGEIKRKED